jgi:uncharacterized protein DUF2637
MRAAQLETAARVTIAAALGGIGAAAGFEHTHRWAVENEQGGWIAWAVAVVIEGMAIMAGFEIRRDRRAGHTKLLTFPVIVLVVAFVVQMAAQVSQARDTFAGWLIAAAPALGFLVVVKLLLRAPVPVDEEAEEHLAPVVAVADRPAPMEPPVPVYPERPALPAREVPITPAMQWLPMAVRDQVAATVRDVVFGGGRPIEVADLQSVVQLPEPTLADLVAEINAATR